MRIIPRDKWGPDHRSTLLYIETRLVDGDGRPQNDKMRTNPRRHKALQGRIAGMMRWSDDEYSSRLANGDRESGHDDWDCVDDMIAAGLILSRGTGLHPRYELTDAGWAEAHRLRRELADRRMAEGRGA